MWDVWWAGSLLSLKPHKPREGNAEDCKGICDTLSSVLEVGPRNRSEGSSSAVSPVPNYVRSIDRYPESLAKRWIKESKVCEGQDENAETIESLRRQQYIHTYVSNPERMEAVIENILKDFPLADTEQRLGFTILARKFIYGKNEQLLMKIVGEAGCGKSEVVKMLRMFVERVSLSDALFVSAFSGVATVGAGGKETICKTICWNPIRESIYRMTEGKKGKLRKKFAGVLMIIIDEISFVSADTLCYVNEALRAAGDENKVFGGFSLVICGDFLQMNVVSAPSLLGDDTEYVDGEDAILRTKKTRLRETVKKRSAEMQKIIATGRYLFARFQLTITLKGQYRIKDPVLRDILTHIREGNYTNEDHAVLSKRVADKMSVQEIKSTENHFRNCNSTDKHSELGDSMSELKEGEHAFGNAPAFVAKNLAVHELNKLFVKHRESNLRSIPCLKATDEIVGIPGRLTGRVGEEFSNCAGVWYKLQKLQGRIPMLGKDFLLKLTQNLDNEKGLANGTFGYIVGIVGGNVDDNGDVHADEIKGILFQVVGSEVKVKLTHTDGTSVGDNVVFIPLRKCSSGVEKNRIDFTIGGNKVKTPVRRTQVPIVSAQATTAHSCQGRTVNCGFIDISIPKDISTFDPRMAYVLLSRFPYLKHIIIMRDFDVRAIRLCYPRGLVKQNMEKELEQEQTLLELLRLHGDKTKFYSEVNRLFGY